MITFDNCKLNINGLLNKYGENIIYYENVEIIKFGVGSINQGKIFLSGGFMSIYPGQGYGKFAIAFLFYRLPYIIEIWLESHDNILPFWKKCGGIVTERTYDGYNIVAIYRK